MSDQNPFNNDSTRNSAWQSSPDFPDPVSSDSNDGMKDKANHKLDEMSGKADDMTHKAKDMAGERMHQAEEMAGRTQDRVDQGMNKAADSMDKGAEMLRQRGDEQGGTAGNVANQAADAMESASSYLHNTDTGEMMDQLEAYIRKNPTQALLIGAGVGFVLAKAFS